MKKQLLTITTFAILGFSNLVNAQAPNWAWAKGTGGNDDDAGNSVTSDALGNVIAVGNFRSQTVAFGSTTLTNLYPNKNDIFIVKYDPTGIVLWAKTAGGDDHDYATSVSADAWGNIIVVGHFHSYSITFGSTTLYNTNPLSYFDIFIVKYDSAGNVIWAKLAGGNRDEQATSVKVDAIGNFIVAGVYNGTTIMFGTINLLNTSAGTSDMFIAKYDSAGTALWAKSSVSYSNEYAKSATYDASGNISVAGYFTGSTVTFNTTTLTSSGGVDIFIVKYDPTGALLLANSAGGSGNDYANSITADVSGNLIVAGYFGSATFTFGPTTLTNVSLGYSDMFILKYDASGTALWAQSAGGNYSDVAYSVTNDASGNIIVAGSFNSQTIVFGSTTLTNASTSNFADIFITKYNSAGSVLWVKSAVGNYDEEVYSVTVGGWGNLMVTGYFRSPPIVFGTTTLTNAGNNDIFISKLDGTTGIESAGNTHGFSIYPNPANDLFFISYTSLSNKVVSVSITDITGEIIYSTRTNNTQKLEVNTEDFSAGVYFVQVQTNDFVETKKVVIAR